jgi:electron transfer flavoprotein beta subunit
MKQLQIIVCIKQVPDPEAPPSCFEVDPETKEVVPIGIPPVINPFDENALEAAIRLKEENGGKVIAISLGEKLAKPVLSKAFAAGVDDLILLEDPLFKDLTSYSTASVLSSMIGKIGSYDLILTGRQAGDWDFGITGLLIGQMLKIPSINLARKIKIVDDRFLVEKLSPNGYEIVGAPMPVLVTVSNEIGELRYTSVLSLRAVSKKPMRVYKAEDLGFDREKLENRQIVILFPHRIQRECKFVEGNSPQEKGENLAMRLKEEGVIYKH